MGLIPGLGRSPGRRHGNPLQYLPGELHGQRSLAGNSPQGGKGSDRTEATQHVCMHILHVYKSQLFDIVLQCLHFLKSCLSSLRNSMSSIYSEAETNLTVTAYNSILKDEIINWNIGRKSHSKMLYTLKCFFFFFFLESKGENWRMQMLLPDFPMTDYSWWRVHKRAKLTVKAHQQLQRRRQKNNATIIIYSCSLG